MELVLPQHTHQPNPVTIDAETLVVIGTNGSGKSSFGKDLCKRYKNSVEISAMHALSVKQNDTDNLQEPNELFRLQSMFSERMLMPHLTEYEKLILRLQAEEFEAAVTFKEAAKEDVNVTPPVTKIDLIQQIWEKMFPHNRLIRKSGFFELATIGKNGNNYTAGRMSDGEKLVFYLIGTALSAPREALLIIEEPEILLHNSIKSALWDEIESIRPDCTYVYLTHDIEFASSRINGKRIWTRFYDADARSWDYEILKNNDHLPEELYMEILGSRKPILFIEGTDKQSIDNQLYPLIFPDYKIKPMGGCQKVIETTKAFTQLQDFHSLDSKGIVDRDRRTPEEIDYLQRQHIYVPNVAEVENLLMLEEVIKTVASHLIKDPDEIFAQVRANVIQLFYKDLESQTLLHTRHLVQKKLETVLNRKVASIDQLSEYVDSIHDTIHTQLIYKEIRDEFESYAKNGDYNNILRVYNQKGMLPQSRVCHLCGISNKESYLALVLSILKSDTKEAETIRTAIKASLGIKKESNN